MNKKGFTIVELLAVVVLLSIIMILVIPNIREAFTNGKNKLDDINKKQVEDAAKIIINEVLLCNMSDETKTLLGTNSCKEAKNKLVNGIKNIDVSNLNIDDYRNQCSGTIDIKVDESTFKEEINIDNVICK